MVAFNLLSSEEIAGELAHRTRQRRLAQKLTLEGLSKRSGVPLGTLKKFERTGHLSLLSFIRLVVTLKDESALGRLLESEEFETLDQVLHGPKVRKRGVIS
jgi:hypothetical protein